MSEHDSCDRDGTEQRHAHIAMDDGGCIIYDRENPQAWIQASGTESVVELQP